MTHNRHVYYVYHPRDLANEYTIASGPPGDHELRGERVDRDTALDMGRWVNENPGGASNVTVAPCECGECALSTYADEHPHGALAERVRFFKDSSRARRDAERGHEPEAVWEDS